ncbi:MAG: O-antigen ligase family protein [Actinomycetota bacterium]
MTSQDRRFTALDAVEYFFATPRFAWALSVTIIGTEFCSLLLQEVIGWAGLIGVLSVLVIFAAFSLLARRHSLEWSGLLPISLLVFVGWAAISVFWSQYQWATLGSVVYFGVVTMLGIYIALVRDTIQIARAFGDVLRFTLLLSLGLEIFSGVLIDTPLPFLNIAGDFARLGPLEGIFGTRNQLGVVAVLAIVTFGTELRTRSVQRWTAIGSLVLAFLMLILSRSPIGIGSLVVVALAAAALYGLRRAAPARKRFWQIGLLVVSVAAAVSAWVGRTAIIDVFSASSELNVRLNLWRQVRDLIQLHNLEGWGWVGHWRHDVIPFYALPNFTSQTPSSALNAYLDVWFQVGLVGLLAFLGLLGLTFVRSWLLASRQRSFVYAWPALMLVALLVTSLAESTILVEFGWLTFVVCSVKAARELSWRNALSEATLR